MISNFFKETNFDFDRFKSRVTSNIIFIDAYYIPEDQTCLICGSKSINKNGHITKTVKHCVYHTSLFLVTCHIQRYVCKACGKVFYEKDTFSCDGETLSRETIIIILEKLKYPNITFESVARDLHLSRHNQLVDFVIDVFDKYINYIPKELPTIISLDEKHVNKSMTDNAYLFVILDFKAIKIYDILSSRHKFSIAKYFSRIPPEQRNKVEYITMDMWEPYKDVCKVYFRNAKIAIDPFHVMKTVNYAMDKIRISVMQRYNQKTDILEENHIYYYLLKKYSYLFLKEFDDITDARFYIKRLRGYYDKHSLRAYLLSIDDELRLAYNLTERYREFNKTSNFETCYIELEQLIEDFYNSKLIQFINVAKTLDTWKEYIINSFIVVPDALTKPKTKDEEPKPRRLSNGPIEGINSIIEKINMNGNGYSNFHRLKNRAIYVINDDAAILSKPLKLKKNKKK